MRLWVTISKNGKGLDDQPLSAANNILQAIVALKDLGKFNLRDQEEE